MATECSLRIMLVDDEEMENAAAGLVDGFLLKPIKLLELDSAIAQAVDGRNRQ